MSLPTDTGHFGQFGGRFVPEALQAALAELTDAFDAAWADPSYHAELEKLPGIGEKLAGSIIEYRTANGPFKTADGLMNVPGIGQAKFDAVKGSIKT